MKTAVLLVFLSGSSLARADGAIDVAIAKGLRRVEQGAANYPRQRQCFSCHHQALPIFVLTTARSRTVAADDKLLAEQVAFTVRALTPNRERFLKGQGIGGGNDTAAYALATLDAGGQPADELTDAMVLYLL